MRGGGKGNCRATIKGKAIGGEERGYTGNPEGAPSPFNNLQGLLLLDIEKKEALSLRKMRSWGLGGKRASKGTTFPHAVKKGLSCKSL